MKRALLVPICLLLIACGLSGCDDDDDVTFVNDYYTGLRVIHAGYDAPPAAVFLNGALVVDSLEFGESSGYALVLSDVYDMEITLQMTRQQSSYPLKTSFSCPWK